MALGYYRQDLHQDCQGSRLDHHLGIPVLHQGILGRQGTHLVLLGNLPGLPGLGRVGLGKTVVEMVVLQGSHQSVQTDFDTTSIPSFLSILCNVCKCG